MTNAALQNAGMLADNSVIAERLVQLREAVATSQAELCKAIGVQPNRWNQYESGERRVTLDVAARLVSTYGVTLDWIYLGDIAGMPKRVLDRLMQAAQ